MKKLLLITVLTVTASFSAFAQLANPQAGVDCVAADARCSGFDLDVEADVLQAIQFEQDQALNLGEVTRGEVVTVAYDGSTSTRGRQYGTLFISFDEAIENITINCLASDSQVDFGSADVPNLTTFDSCSLTGSRTADLGGGMLSPQPLAGIGSDSLTLDNSDGAAAMGQVDIGASITVPSENVEDGAKTGNLRIEVIYE